MTTMEYTSDDVVLTKDNWIDALRVQDACNISGVAYSLGENTRKVRDESQARQKLGISLPEKWVEQHPIIILFACKIVDLTGVAWEGGRSYGVTTYNEALRVAYAKTEGKGM